MKYYAFVEEVKDIENLEGASMRKCPTMETAIAVSIMANKTNPLVAVADSNGEIITIDPKAETVTIDGLMKAEYILVELDKNGVPVLSTSDTIPFSINKHAVLVNFNGGNKYIEANPNCNTAKDSLLKIEDVKTAAQQSMIQHSVYSSAPFGFKRTRVTFGYNFRAFSIIGTPSKDILRFKMDDQLIPEDKLLVLDNQYGDATHLYWISSFSDLARIYEENGERHDYHFYIQGESKNELIQLRNVETEEVDL